MEQTYLISYDLHQNGQNYDKMRELIEKSFRMNMHCLQSTYLVVSDKNANGVRNALLAALDDNDKLLVTPVSPRGSVAHGFTARERLQMNLYFPDQLVP